VYIADETPVDVLLASFDAAGIDVAAAVESGALSVHTTGDRYGPVDAFDPDGVIDGLGELLREVADSDEYNRLRITGEMTWTLEGDADTLDALAEYERVFNTHLPDKPVLAICQYNRTRFSSATLADILWAHPQHVYNATVTQNFAYVPLETFSETGVPVEDSLTECPLRVLRVAYHSGYFAWPRHSTAEEIGHSLDITQPTFAKHPRTSERKFLSLLFDSEPV